MFFLKMHHTLKQTHAAKEEKRKKKNWTSVNGFLCPALVCGSMANRFFFCRMNSTIGRLFFLSLFRLHRLRFLPSKIIGSFKRKNGENEKKNNNKNIYETQKIEMIRNQQQEILYFNGRDQRWSIHTCLALYDFLSVCAMLWAAAATLILLLLLRRRWWRLLLMLLLQKISSLSFRIEIIWTVQDFVAMCNVRCVVRSLNSTS